MAGFSCDIAIEKGLCKGGECCGIVFFTKELAKSKELLAQVKPIEIHEFNDEIYPQTTDGLCVFLNRQTRKCVIYNDRPKVCREYGLVKNLECPYIKPNGNLRTPAKIRRMQRKINHYVDDSLKNLAKERNKC